VRFAQGIGRRQKGTGGDDRGQRNRLMDGSQHCVMPTMDIFYLCCLRKVLLFFFPSTSTAVFQVNLGQSVSITDEICLSASGGASNTQKLGSTLGPT